MRLFNLVTFRLFDRLKTINIYHNYVPVFSPFDIHIINFSKITVYFLIITFLIVLKRMSNIMFCYIVEPR